tara:strand:+ start:227 stop:517 length:291 start_codon:yes stop_codon:yes gene_type:complete
MTIGKENTILAIEVLIIVAAALIAWGSFSTKVEATAEDLKEVRSEQDALSVDVSDIKSDIRVMKNNQTHYTNSLRNNTTQQNEIIENQKKILEALK